MTAASDGAWLARSRAKTPPAKRVRRPAAISPGVEGDGRRRPRLGGDASVVHKGGEKYRNHA